MTHVTINCLECNGEFTITKARHESGRGKFCSRECKRKHLTFKFNCAYCGKETSAYTSRKGRKKYCSKECIVNANPMLKKGKEHYNYQGARHSNTYRREAFDLLPSLCNRCGSINNLQVHHKNHDHYDNRPENWEILCFDCHSIHHAECQSHDDVTKICPYCKNEFTVKYKRRNYVKHCSKSCAAKHQHLRAKNNIS